MKINFVAAVLAFCALSVFGAENNQAQTPNVAPEYPYAPPANYAPPQHYFQGLPQKIMTTIQKMYPGVFIVDVDFEPYGYEIELSNRMEMHFDKNGNLLGQKWDD